MGMLFCTSSSEADFYEDFEAGQIDWSNWTLVDYGGLDGVQQDGKLIVSGNYDPGETSPNTGGWNHYFLIYNTSFNGYLDFSVKNNITTLAAQEIAVGIGILETTSIVYDNITTWVQYFYGAENAIGKMASWHNLSSVKVYWDDEDITVGKTQLHRFVVHDNSSIQLILNGVTKAWWQINYTQYYPFIHVGMKYAGSFVEVEFDDFVLVDSNPAAVLNVSDETPDVEHLVSFDGSGSSYGMGDPSEYYFDFGDGNNTGWIVDSFTDHVYYNEGTYDARLKVRSDTGLESDWATVSLCVDCAIPTANLTATPLTTGTLGSVEFSAIQSTDLDGEILGYFFDYGDWSNSGWIMSPLSNYSYSDDGDYDARLKVLDDDGHESNWSEPITITVLNEEPIPLFWYSSDHVNQKETVTFDGSKSFDSDGWVTSWFFDFGDGTDTGWMSYPNVTHVYQDVGEYMVSLIVRDNDGKESTFITVSHRFYVHNTPPNAIVTVFDPEIAPRTNASFDASHSYDPDGVVTTYIFDFGDGTDSGWITTPATGHIYLDEGVYDITVKVRDDDGAESVWSTAVQILVERRLPHPYLNSTAIEIFEGEEIFLSGQFSTGFDGHISAWIFDFGEGTSTGWIASPYTTHVYPEAGEYIVTLRVRDSLGGESVGVDELTIHVMEEEDGQDAEFNWWMIIAIIALVLWTITLVLALTYRRRIEESEDETEDFSELSENNEDG